MLPPLSAPPLEILIIPTGHRSDHSKSDSEDISDAHSIGVRMSRGEKKLRMQDIHSFSLLG